MEEVINKPENQFKDILNDLIDYSKDSVEKNALIKEVCQVRRPNKPAASLNSSIYSSAASSSSSSSSASASSNSASASSTSSTLSSPSQNNTANDANASRGLDISHDLDNVEVPKMEVLGKKARILEHRSASSKGNEFANSIGQINATSSHSDARSTSLNSTSPWKTISGKRDRRRKKPTEQPVLSQHIPGHKGEQEVDWLVSYIEFGVNNANITNSKSSRKITKNVKQQSKRQPSQSAMKQDREISQRKSTNKPTNTQIRPPHQQSQLQQLRSQQQLTRQIANHDHEREEVKQEEEAVTFAEHICITDDDLSGRYVFGFFEEQRHLHSGNQAKLSKTIEHNENPPFNNLDQVGQKHKTKYHRASLNSEQNRYKFNDNIDADSFNYHQILEYISNSWENTTKSHRPLVNNTVS